MLQLICFSILDLLLAFKWLVCYYLKKTYQHVNDLKSNGMSDFDIKNNSQTFLARTLSLVYGEVSKICVCVCVYFLIGTEEVANYISNNLYQKLLNCKL